MLIPVIALFIPVFSCSVLQIDVRREVGSFLLGHDEVEVLSHIHILRDISVYADDVAKLAPALSQSECTDAD